MIIDYSTLRPPMALLQAAGVTAVGRYIGWDGQPGYANIGKNLTVAEKDELLAAGIQVFLSFEYAADAALSGAAQGRKDAALADRQLSGLGMRSAGTAVYYAVDFDLGDFAPHLPEGPANARAKLGPVAVYFDGIHATTRQHEVDAYGGFWAVSRLLDAGLITRGWQTLAWSSGSKVPAGATHCVVENGFLRDTRATLLQLIRQVFGAADVNIHEAKGADFGQWPRPAVPKPPPPAVITDGILVSKAMGWTGHRMRSADHGENWTEINE